MSHAQLTDEHWEFIEPFLPTGRFGPYPERLREQFDGVIWRFRTGGQWREMPERFGARQTVRNGFDQCGTRASASAQSVFKPCSFGFVRPRPGSDGV